MAPEEGRNVRNKLVTITLAVIFMIKKGRILIIESPKALDTNLVWKEVQRKKVN